MKGGERRGETRRREGNTCGSVPVALTCGSYFSKYIWYR